MGTVAAVGAAASLLVLAALPTSARAVELVVSAGAARYEKCGGAGCWQQPPLPFEWRLKTGTLAIGLRAGPWEAALHHLGRVSVHGYYVPDADYEPRTQQVRDGARNWRGLAQQETYGLSLRAAPRWQWGPLALTTSVGALVFHQRLEIEIDWLDGACCATHFDVVESKVTPIVGLELAYAFTPALRIGLGADAAWRLRTTDSPAGGGDSNKPGLVTWFLVVRHAF